MKKTDFAKLNCASFFCVLALSLPSLGAMKSGTIVGAACTDTHQQQSPEYFIGHSSSQCRYRENSFEKDLEIAKQDAINQCQAAGFDTCSFVDTSYQTQTKNLFSTFSSCIEQYNYTAKYIGSCSPPVTAQLPLPAPQAPPAISSNDLAEYQGYYNFELVTIDGLQERGRAAITTYGNTVSIVIPSKVFNGTATIIANCDGANLCQGPSGDDGKFRWEVRLYDQQSIVIAEQSSLYGSGWHDDNYRTYLLKRARR